MDKEDWLYQQMEDAHFKSLIEQAEREEDERRSTYITIHVSLTIETEADVD